MSIQIITREQLEHLPDLHRKVAETLIRTGKWRLVEIDPANLAKIAPGGGC
jgi:Ser-tRNA(Ala) deacylase AlaX